MPALYLQATAVLLVAVFATWMLSVVKRNVGIVDSLWPLLFLMFATVMAVGGQGNGTRVALLWCAVAAWAVRLSAHISWRNWGEAEDRRYQAIRARNQPHFELRSLYLVFGLQALLAAFIALPLYGAMTSARPLGALDAVGALLWAVGLAFEAGGDWQLARFKSKVGNRGQVMDRGLWRFTRHPNYFGDFCVWWGFYGVAVSAGAWWSFPGPLLMSVLLMRVSGVTLLERDIGERRPGYASYIQRTNAFFPGLPRRGT